MPLFILLSIIPLCFIQSLHGTPQPEFTSESRVAKPCPTLTRVPSPTELFNSEQVLQALGVLKTPHYRVGQATYYQQMVEQAKFDQISESSKKLFKDFVPEEQAASFYLTVQRLRRYLKKSMKPANKDVTSDWLKSAFRISKNRKRGNVEEQRCLKRLGVPNNNCAKQRVIANVLLSDHKAACSIPDGVFQPDKEQQGPVFIIEHKSIRGQKTLYRTKQIRAQQEFTKQQKPTGIHLLVITADQQENITLSKPLENSLSQFALFTREKQKFYLWNKQTHSWQQYPEYVDNNLETDVLAKKIDFFRE